MTKWPVQTQSRNNKRFSLTRYLLDKFLEQNIFTFTYMCTLVVIVNIIIHGIIKVYKINIFFTIQV